MSGASRPRLIALALITRPDRSALLVSSGHDASRNEDFHRLLGGGIDFGETGAAAVTRELDEEIGIKIEVKRFSGVLENIYSYNGRPGHEIVLVYEAVFIDAARYADPEYPGLEVHPVNASWRSTDHPPAGVPLYPPGAIDLLSQ